MSGDRRWRNALGPALVGVATLACGSSSDAGGDSGDSTGLMVYAPCAAEERVGRFSINLDEEFTSIEGRVLDGVEPARIPNVAEVSGQCRLLRNPELFCDPACESGMLCAGSDVCVTEPEAHNLGTVSIDGMVDEIAMTPSGTLAYRNSGSLSHPGFEPGASILLQSEGGDYQAFSLRGWGISYLEADPQAVLEEGSPMTLNWATLDDPGPARIVITLNVNNHGATSAWVECEVADTGSFDIPAAMIGELTSIGISGFPTVVLRRRTADSASIDVGCVELELVSERRLDVDIPGLISCNSDGDCDTGTCQADLTCG